MYGQENIMSRRGLRMATSMNQMPAIGFLMIGGAFIDQGRQRYGQAEPVLLTSSLSHWPLLA